ncbi:DUF4920 domain-containing protein [uncultured Polaribacter sp.]|uniref:DUF4920 domain-containing protein n=1 Tax=uncultured Polaribacter sp. TaxID=174711 RepID=UPI00260D8BCD|nr:DUF4920 domain-containing protein [uncultured Polaribacter sp.]
MKYNSYLILVLFLFFIQCKEGKKAEQKNIENAEISYHSFGEKISSEGFLNNKQMLAKFEEIKIGDTLHVKFKGTINDVCSKKGCWMKLSLDNKKETMVRFKDYGFFMPLDAKGKNVIVNGKAFVKQTSVVALQHYAEDAGKSKEEIAKITQPKITYAFEADGVLME